MPAGCDGRSVLVTVIDTLPGVVGPSHASLPPFIQVKGEQRVSSAWFDLRDIKLHEKELKEAKEAAEAASEEQLPGEHQPRDQHFFVVTGIQWTLL